MDTVTVASFRASFPEFASADIFPDSSITFWLNWAYLLLNADRWRSVLPLGVMLFVAHNLVIEAFNAQTVDVGGLPGVNKGAIASETPGSVNVSYDTAGSSIEKAGHFNLTTFGTRYIMLARMAGMGGIQVGTPGCGPFGPGFGAPWFGPPGGLV